MLHVVAGSHLDTQWRWTVLDTVRELLPNTVREATDRFPRFPSFQLTFEGAFRYRLLQEYHPALFAEVREWVRRGRWHPAGSMLESPDVNLPSPESLLRHILYGSRFLRRELGHGSRDLYLPDCFGFGWALPTVAAHCGLDQLLSQKHIKWGHWVAPFSVGVWEGPDGAELLTLLDPEGYGDGLDEKLAEAPRWRARIEALGRAAGLWRELKIFGVGDRGGAPDEASLALLEEAAASQGPLEVVCGPPAAFAEATSAEQRARLPRHRGELLLPVHGTGCLTSQAPLKTANRANERLAAAAEAAAAAAHWLGAAPYSSARLEQAWESFLWHQHHDDLTGTSIPAAYDFTWQDQEIARRLFREVFEGSVAAVARGLDTQVAGVPVVAFNPLTQARRDVVELELPAPAAGRGYRVREPGGTEAPCQWHPAGPGRVRLLALATLPPLGCVVLSVEEAPGAAREEGSCGLAVSPAGLESPRYRVTLDSSGNVAAILDRELGRELLAGPVELELLADRSRRWPAWEVLYEDLGKPARERFGSPAAVTVVEQGPVRVALEIARRVGRTRLVEQVRLTAGDAGDWVEWHADLDWRARARLLKARFPLAARAPEATFGLGVAAIRRGNATPDRYEVPAQQWVDLTDASGDWGVSLLAPDRYGWDKPDDGTLRLSLARSPRARWKFRHQAWQDLGSHRTSWALAGHAGPWEESRAVAQAARFEQRPVPFIARSHPGPLGRRFSFLEVAGAGVAVTAVKRREEGEELVVRLAAAGGRATEAALGAATPITEALDLDGLERERGPLPVAGGAVRLPLRRFELRTLALRLTPPATALPPPEQTPMDLPFDTPAASFHSAGEEVDFDGRGNSLPGELLPRELDLGGIRFALGPWEPGGHHCLACHGQLLPLAGGGGDRTLYLLACSVGEASRLPLAGDGTLQELVVHAWDGPLLRRRRRQATPERQHEARLAWAGTHRHGPGAADLPCAPCYLFAYRVTLPAGLSALRVGPAPRVRLFAATLVAGNSHLLEPASPR